MPSLHPVVQILCRRRDEGSVPKARTDGYRVGLAVEGGGMRGIVSGAMMSALIDHELLCSFDAVYAFSAGALNSAYFLSGLGWYALSVYYDDLINQTFLDAHRILKRQPIMSLDYVMDVVMKENKPLDYAVVLGSPIEFHVIVSSLQSLSAKVFKHFSSTFGVR